MKENELVELVMRAVPHSDQITAWEIEEEHDAIRFTWRGTRFRVTTEESCAVGGPEAFLMRALLRGARAEGKL